MIFLVSIFQMSENTPAVSRVKMGSHAPSRSPAVLRLLIISASGICMGWSVGIKISSVQQIVLRDGMGRNRLSMASGQWHSAVIIGRPP